MQIVRHQCQDSNTPWLHGEKTMEVQSLVLPWTPFYVLALADVTLDPFPHNKL